MHKTYDAERVKAFLDEQNHVSLKMVSAFSGGRVAAVEQDVCSIEDPIKALEAAKKRAHKSIRLPENYLGTIGAKWPNLRQ